MLTRYGDITFYSPGKTDVFLRVRCASGNMVSVRVHPSNDYRIKINKKSVVASGGAYGLFCFLSDCIRNDFMMCYVNAFIRQFCQV